MSRRDLARRVERLEVSATESGPCGPHAPGAPWLEAAAKDPFMWAIVERACAQDPDLREFLETLTVPASGCLLDDVYRFETKYKKAMLDAIHGIIFAGRGNFNGRSP